MSKEDEIKELQRKIESLRRQQRYCNHNWLESKYDPEERLVSDDRAGYETHGVDRWPIPSFHNENVDRWSRTCEMCGHKEYTYSQETVKVEKRPKFN